MYQERKNSKHVRGLLHVITGELCMTDTSLQEPDSSYSPAEPPSFHSGGFSWVEVTIEFLSDDKEAFSKERIA